jgi:hypothetical protein
LARALLQKTGALGLSLPFPALRHRQRHYIQKNLSAKKVLSFLSQIEDQSLLPIHLWGMPGLLDNEFPEPDRFHIGGLGFALDSEASLDKAKGFLHAGGSADLGPSTGQEQLVVAPHSPMEPSCLSLDVGMQTPLAFLLKSIPLEQNRALAGWSLLMERPASKRISLGASGPAGGQFGGMPSIVTWLLDPASRPPQLSDPLRGSAFDISDWARLTRLEPASCLGLTDTGHLRVGTRANIAIYDLRAETAGENMLSALADCWCLIKDGVLVREEGVFTGRKPPTKMCGRHVDEDDRGFAEADLFQNTTLRFENLGLLPCERNPAESL